MHGLLSLLIYLFFDCLFFLPQLVDRALAAIIGSTATLAALAMLHKVRLPTCT